MDDTSEPRQSDVVLIPLLRASDDSEFEERLAQIISDHADPVVKGILRRKIRISFHNSTISESELDAQDIYGNVMVRLVRRLRELSSPSKLEPINNFRSYVATLVYHEYNEQFRNKFPQRHRLKNRVRYLLSHHRLFTLWKSESGDWIAGLKNWTDRSPQFHSLNYRKLLEHPARCITKGVQPEDDTANSLSIDVDSIFNFAGCPMELDDLVDVLATLIGVKDAALPLQSEEDERTLLPDRFDIRSDNSELDYDQMSYLRRLWSEIEQLPSRQRFALLLNLKDSEGEDSLSLFPISGIVSIPEICQILEMSMESFAAVWKELPLEDSAIAEILGITRQQVINLRKSARQRLARRMRSSNKI